jgi:hypothetical protein
MTRVLFKERDFGAYIRLSARFAINHYSFIAVGGPDEATISARGDLNDLLALANLLRCPTELYDKMGNLRWWGFVHSVEIRFGQRIMNISLGKLYNRVAVTYAERSSSKVASMKTYTTDWVNHSDSQAIYGVKELLKSIGESDIIGAVAARDQILNDYKYPILSPTTGQSAGGSWSALITCKGWIHSLGWKYYALNRGQEMYDSLSSGGSPQPLNYVRDDYPTAAAIKQTVLVTSAKAWELNSIGVRVRRYGTPDGDLQIKLSQGDTELVVVAFTPDELSENFAWYEKEVPAGLFLQPNTTYIIEVRSLSSETPAGDSDPGYYAVEVNELLEYQNGSMLLVIGGHTETRDPDADMYFTLKGTTPTDEQISDLVDTAGQFITSVTVFPPSGISTNPYRDGANSAKYYLEELLQTGLSNGKRYIAYIDPWRRLSVYPEPSISTLNLYVDENDNWTTAVNTNVQRASCPCGVWYRMTNLPQILIARGVASVTDYFIERSEYYEEKDQLRTEPKGASSAYDIVELE